MAGQGHGEKLTRKQEQAIACLLSESTVEKAAAKARVGYRTLKGWLALPDFRDAYRAAQKQVVEEAVVVLKKCATGAALTLGRALDCGKPNVEVRAAVAVFDTIMKATDHLELTNRIEALEQAEAARKRRQKLQ
jgi:hypothetical protein